MIFWAVSPGTLVQQMSKDYIEFFNSCTNVVAPLSSLGSLNSSILLYRSSSSFVEFRKFCGSAHRVTHM